VILITHRLEGLAELVDERYTVRSGRVVREPIGELSLV